MSVGCLPQAEWVTWVSGVSPILLSQLVQLDPWPMDCWPTQQGNMLKYRFIWIWSTCAITQSLHVLHAHTALMSCWCCIKLLWLLLFRTLQGVFHWQRHKLRLPPLQAASACAALRLARSWTSCEQADGQDWAVRDSAAVLRTWCSSVSRTEGCMHVAWLLVLRPHRSSAAAV